MRVVLDTNVLVSALLTPSGTCARVVDLATEGAVVLHVDDRILAEYESVLHRRNLKIDASDADLLLDLLRHVGVPVPALPLASRLPDMDDMPFLEVAAASDALLVTGNTRHFPARAVAGVTVITPADLLARIQRPR